ncbi:MAG TPA: hypothetical protein PKI03_16525 [Pseudomonadota bacterium]|nr:hypothetical protein [Pseudomonadota bacterium]
MSDMPSADRSAGAPQIHIEIDALIIDGLSIVGPAERFEPSFSTELTRLLRQPEVLPRLLTQTVVAPRQPLRVGGGTAQSAEAAGRAVAQALVASILGDPR